MYFDIEDACHPRPASPGSAEALAAGPAAKEVGEEKSENGVVDTCGGREKKATAGGARIRAFLEKERAGKMCNSKCRPSYFRTIFGPGEAEGGLFRAPERATGERARGKAQTPGRLKRAPVNAAGVRPHRPAHFWQKP